jgi:hypothetical protein
MNRSLSVFYPLPFAENQILLSRVYFVLAPKSPRAMGQMVLSKPRQLEAYFSSTHCSKPVALLLILLKA